MNIDALLSVMTPEIYQRLRTAAETGKWADGNSLNDEQRESCLQAVLMYQAKIERSNEHMTVNAAGEIVHKTKSQLRAELQSTDGHTIARFTQDDI